MVVMVLIVMLQNRKPILVSHLHTAHAAGTFTFFGGPAQIHLLVQQPR